MVSQGKLELNLSALSLAMAAVAANAGGAVAHFTRRQVAKFPLSMETKR
jgi:hypothetical protein